MSGRAKGTGKRILFMMVPALMIFAGATILLSLLNRRGVVDTESLDDVVLDPITYRGLLQKQTTDTGKQYVVINPSMVNDTFAIQRQPDDYLIFITGGSFVLGTPYVHHKPSNKGPGTIPGWMQAILAQRLPDRNIKVVNFGSGGTNSIGIRDMVAELVEAKPDLIIVATGNNEGFLPQTPLNRPLRKWVIYRGLRKLLLPEPKLEDRPVYTPQDSDTAAIEKSFQLNISDMVRICRESKTPLALATLPINLRFNGPAKLKNEKAWFYQEQDQYIAEGYKLCRGNKYARALTTLGKSRNAAYALWAVGMCHEIQGDYSSAKTAYKHSVQLMPQNRVRPSYNEYVRKTAAKNGLPLLDIEKYLEGISDTGIADSKLFVDHCHLAWWGYYLIAEYLSDEIINNMLIGEEADRDSNISIEALIKKNGWEILYEVPESRMPIFTDEMPTGSLMIM